MPTAPMRSQVAPVTVWTVAFHVLGIAAVLFIIYTTRQVVWWIVVATFLALALDPLISRLEKAGLRRGLAVLAVLIAGLGLGAVLLATVIPVLIDQGTRLVQGLPDMVDRLRSSGPFQWAENRFGVIARAKTEAAAQAGAAAGPLFHVVEGVFTGVVALVTVVALTVFMSLFGGDLFERALRWISPQERPRYAALGLAIRRTAGGYVSGALIIALIGGVVTGVATAALGVPYFLPLGLIMGLLGVIPFIGSIIGGTLVVGATFLTAGVKAGVIALAIFVVYQQAENHILQPLVQRKTIRMSPLVIAVVMLVGTALWGVVGALLSLPIAGTIQVVLEDRLARRQARWASDAPAPDTTAEPPILTAPPPSAGVAPGLQRGVL